MLKKRIEEIDEQIIAIRETSASPAIAVPQIERQKRNRSELQKQLDKRRATCMPEVESRYRARLKIDLTEKLDTATRRRTLFVSQIKGLRDQAETLSKQILSLDPSLQNEPPDLAHLKDEVDSTKVAVDQIRRNIMMLSVEPTSSRVSLQMRATPPTDKDYTRQTKLGGAGGVSAFVFVLFTVALWEFRTRRISMTNEVSQGLGLHVVGTLPRVRPAGKASGREDPSQAQLEEAVDGVRTMLLHAAQRAHARGNGHECLRRRGEDFGGDATGGEPGAGMAQDAADRRRPAQSGGAPRVRLAARAGSERGAARRGDGRGRHSRRRR